MNNEKVDSEMTEKRKDERLAEDILLEDCGIDCEDCFFEACHCLNQGYCFMKEQYLKAANHNNL